MGDQLYLGLETTVIGVGIVFLALYALSVILQIFQRVFYKEPKMDTSSESESNSSFSGSENQMISQETVAAIAAAIAVATGKNMNQFSIVGIRQAGEKSAWNPGGWKMAGRTQLMESRQELYR